MIQRRSSAGSARTSVPGPPPASSGACTAKSCPLRLSITVTCSLLTASCCVNGHRGIRPTEQCFPSHMIASNRPISACRLGEMPIQSRG